jgi:hypothetical protein
MHEQRPRRSDQMGQQPGRRLVGQDRAADECRYEARLIGRDPHVAGERQRKAAPGRYAVDRGQHGFAHGAKAPDPAEA